MTLICFAVRGVCQANDNDNVSQANYIHEATKNVFNNLKIVLSAIFPKYLTNLVSICPACRRVDHRLSCCPIYQANGKYTAIFIRLTTINLIWLWIKCDKIQKPKKDFLPIMVILYIILQYSWIMPSLSFFLFRAPLPPSNPILYFMTQIS